MIANRRRFSCCKKFVVWDFVANKKWEFVVVVLCLSGILSWWDYVVVGICHGGIMSRWEFVVVGVCREKLSGGKLSGWENVEWETVRAPYSTLPC